MPDTRKRRTATEPRSRQGAASTRPPKTEAGPPRVDPERMKAILDILEMLYPQTSTALDWHSPLELLVATILSAQCTDEQVNRVMPGLFARFPTAAALAEAPIEAIETLIHSTGFFRQKARSIQGTCRLLVMQFGGEVPRTMAELVTLPGVARKTANVVLGTAFGLAEGVVVDTHVRRLSGRLGLSRETDPGRIEQDLMAAVPRERWIALGHQLIRHGRALCPARRPLCEQCPLAPHCPSSTVASPPKVASRPQTGKERRHG